MASKAKERHACGRREVRRKGAANEEQLELRNLPCTHHLMHKPTNKLIQQGNKQTNALTQTRSDTVYIDLKSFTLFYILIIGFVLFLYPTAPSHVGRAACFLSPLSSYPSSYTNWFFQHTYRKLLFQSPPLPLFRASHFHFSYWSSRTLNAISCPPPALLHLSSSS